MEQYNALQKIWGAKSFKWGCGGGFFLQNWGIQVFGVGWWSNSYEQIDSRITLGSRTLSFFCGFCLHSLEFFQIGLLLGRLIWSEIIGPEGMVLVSSCSHLAWCWFQMVWNQIKNGAQRSAGMCMALQDGWVFLELQSPDNTALGISLSWTDPHSCTPCADICFFWWCKIAHLTSA